MCLKRIDYLKYISVILIVSACNRSDTKMYTNEDSVQNACKHKLMAFADTLSLDRQHHLLNYYFDDKCFDLKGCNLKEMRNDFDVQTAVLLIMFKINNHYLKDGYKDVLAEPIKGISESSKKIMQEYIFMVYKKDIAFPENLRTSDVKKIVLREQSFLKNSKIKHLYDASFELEKSAKKRFIF